jgi:dienelactone hydrolase
MLAELGYLAAAADMHGDGRVLEGAEMATAITSFQRDPEMLRRRVRAAFDALCATPGVACRNVAAIGYCFGGTAVLELARSSAPVAAVASFHGLLTTGHPARPGAISARILACTGARDPLVPLGDVAAFQEEMALAEADWQLLVFGRAMHSFTNEAVDASGDPRMRYDPLAERQSWAVLQQFLHDSFAVGPVN